MTRKKATKKRTTAKRTPSQVLQQNFDNMDLSYGMLPEYNTPENEMQTIETTEYTQNDDISNNRTAVNATAIDSRDEFNFESSLLEDNEFPLDRQFRLLREQEEEEERANLGRRLIAPRDEIRHRNRQPKNKQTNPESIHLLKEKQLKLLDSQLDYHKILIETARVALEKEKLLLSQARSRVIHTIIWMNKK